MQNKEPTTNPIAIGISKERYNVATEVKYASYTPKSIKIKVLLTPGITTPADIKNPENMRKM